MNLPRLANVPHVGCAQIDCETCSVVVSLPNGGHLLDILVSEVTRDGRTVATATMPKGKVAELRDWLNDAIDSMPGELGD